MPSQPTVDVSQFLYQHASSPFRVHSVEFNGIKHTSKDLLESLITPLYSSKNLGEGLSILQSICGRLEMMEIAREFDITLEREENAKKIGEGLDVKIKIKVKEVPTLSVQTGTEFGNGDGSVNASYFRKNLFGRGEKFEASASYGNKITSSVQFLLSKCIDPNAPEKVLELRGFQNILDQQYSSSFTVRNRALQLHYQFLSSWGNHSLGYSANWSTLSKVGSNASDKVREQAGHSLKSSIYHHFINEVWEDPTSISNGYSFKLKQELAGLKGDQRFIKSDFSYHSLVELSKGWFVGLGITGGLLYPLDKAFSKPIKPTPINERFFLGNPTSVRGFRDFGIGPRDKSDSLGGDLSFSAGMSLFTPLPYIQSNRFKGHFFVNAGNLRLFNHDLTISEQFKRLLMKPSSSFGFGLVYTHSMVRIEANYVLPISQYRFDKISPNFQLGLGIDFL